MTTQCGFVPLHIWFKRSEICSWPLWKKVLKLVHIVMARFLVYYIKKYSIQEDFSSAMGKKVASTVDIIFMSTVGIRLMLYIDITKTFQTNFFSAKICFHNLFGQWSFTRHILDIILTSCVDVHIICAIWHQQDVKIRSTDIMLWYTDQPRHQSEVRVLTGYWCT